jgi:hypothetical protein
MIHCSEVRLHHGQARESLGPTALTMDGLERAYIRTSPCLQIKCVTLGPAVLNMWADLFGHGM